MRVKQFKALFPLTVRQLAKILSNVKFNNPPQQNLPT